MLASVRYQWLFMLLDVSCFKPEMPRNTSIRADDTDWMYYWDGEVGVECFDLIRVETSSKLFLSSLQWQGKSFVDDIAFWHCTSWLIRIIIFCEQCTRQGLALHCWEENWFSRANFLEKPPMWSTSSSRDKTLVIHIFWVEGIIYHLCWI